MAKNKNKNKNKNNPNGYPQCTGRADVALKVFRERVKELEEIKQFKPDMVAFKELNAKYTPDRTHGLLPGVPIGLRLNGRGEAAILGIHRSILSGVDSMKDYACYAVCASGGYKDDADSSRDGTVIYTGSGGQKKGAQVEDQVENTDNLSLINSYADKTPIRMLRLIGKAKHGFPVYEYVGLYRCVEYTHEPSKDGPKVYRFTLKPIEGQTKRHQDRDLHKIQSIQGSLGRLESSIETEASSAVPQCLELIQQLDNLHMSIAILQKSMIGKYLTKFAKRNPQLHSHLEPLIAKWRNANFPPANDNNSNNQRSQASKPALNIKREKEDSNGLNIKREDEDTDALSIKREEEVTDRTNQPPVAKKRKLDSVKHEESAGVANHHRHVAAQPPTNKTSQPPAAGKPKLKAAKHEESADYLRVAAAKPPPPANHVVRKPKPIGLAKLCSMVQGKH